MPLIFSEIIDRGTKIGVWKITEQEDFFSSRTGIPEGISHPRKRLQHLAGRYLLSELMPGISLGDVLAGAAGKPQLPGGEVHFSISHCGDLAAVITSEVSDVGVDIEIPAQKIRLIQHKFLGPAEKDLLKTSGLDEVSSLTLAWSIKEALFKWHGRGAVDFREHLQIKRLMPGNDWWQVDCLFDKDHPVSLKAFSRQINGAILSFVI